MAKLNRIIPFCVWPANWGLTGQRKEKAIAEYEYDGYELKKKLIEIDRNFFGDTVELALKDLELDKEYGRIDDREFDIKKAELEIKDEQELALVKNEIEYRYGNLTEYDRNVNSLKLLHPEGSIEYIIGEINIRRDIGELTNHQADKEIANIKGEPWFAIINSEYLSKDTVGSAINFELDWNDEHITFLMANGYTGQSQEEIIDSWFSSLCRELFNETGGPVSNDAISNLGFLSEHR